MKIELSKDTIESIRKQKTWDPFRSHDFVSTYTLDQNIDKAIKSLLTNCSKMNQNREKSIFVLSDCLASVETIYESLCKHPSGDIEWKRNTLSDTFDCIDDDLNTRILIYQKYHGNEDFEIINNKTISILTTLSVFDEHDVNAMFGIDVLNSQAFRMDKLQHICSALSTMAWGMSADGSDPVEKLRVAPYFANIIFDIEGVFPNVLKDDKSELFWAFVDSLEEIMGFSYSDINAFRGDNYPTDRLDLAITKLYQFLFREVLTNRCNDLYGKSFQDFMDIRNGILKELDLAQVEDDGTSALREYSEFIYNTSFSLMSEALEQIFSLYVNSNGETDCFTINIFRKICFLTRYFMTEDKTCLDILEGVDAIW